MARFVGRHGNLSLYPRDEKKEHYATGQSKILVRELCAQFSQDIVTDWDFEQVSTRFDFPGLPEDRERGGDISPRVRVSAFDSQLAAEQNGWTAEEHDHVVAFLRNHPLNQIEYVEIELPRTPRPWPRYDQTPSSEVIATARSIGVSLEDVAVYERENAHREDLLREIAGELAPIEEPERELIVHS